MNIDDAKEQDERRIAVGTMLHYISEGILEGVWRDFKFTVGQHRRERRNKLTGVLMDAETGKVTITFSMEVDEASFKADMAKRKHEVDEALNQIEDNHVSGLPIEHDDVEEVGDEEG